MQFIKFQSLENLYNAGKVVNNIQTDGESVNEFIVTEKIHGANFAFYSDGEQVRCAKRTSILEPDESFFDWRTVADRYKDIFLNGSKDSVERLKSSGIEGNPYIVVYGELFGGNIQKNMPYPLQQDFVAFDVIGVFDFTEANEKILKDLNAAFYKHPQLDKLICLAYDKLETLHDLNNLGFKTVPVLFTGTLEECMKFNINFPSKLTDEATLKLKGLEDKDSETYKTITMTEGVVIEQRFPKLYGQARPYIKNKTAKFEEKKSVPKQVLTQEQKMDKLEPSERDALTQLLSYVTVGRIESVISKIGEVTIKDFGLVLKNFSLDLYEDFQKDCDNFEYEHKTTQYGVVRFKDFPNSSLMSKIVAKESSDLVRSFLLGGN